MAEILLRIVDKTNDDKELDAQCSKAGDVIVVCPDGWNWGAEELKSDVWRIVKLPGVPPEQLYDLELPLFTEIVKGEATLVRKRAKRLGIEKLDAALAQKLTEQKVGDRKAEIVLTAQEIPLLTAAREIKEVTGKVVIG